MPRKPTGKKRGAPPKRWTGWRDPGEFLTLAQRRGALIEAETMQWRGFDGTAGRELGYEPARPAVIARRASS